jgi:RNA polymerase sigma-70 factor (ECF subfamily)
MRWFQRGDHEHLGDRELVDRFLEHRDEATFRILYRRHTPAIYGLVVRLSSDPSVDPEDIVQVMWIRALDRLDGFRGESALRTWLTGIAINCVREQLRRNKRREVAAPAEPEEVPAKPARGGSSLRIDLERAIAALPRGCREVLILHDIEGYTHHEIGRFLGIESGTSKSQLFRARQALRSRLEMPGAEP